MSYNDGKYEWPAARIARAKKGKSLSPWRKGPAVNTVRAREEFAKRKRYEKDKPMEDQTQ